MIARIWHGYTKPEHADAYEAMLKPELVPGISKAKATGAATCSKSGPATARDWELSRQLCLEGC